MEVRLGREAVVSNSSSGREVEEEAFLAGVASSFKEDFRGVAFNFHDLHVAITWCAVRFMLAFCAELASVMDCLGIGIGCVGHRACCVLRC